MWKIIIQNKGFDGIKPTPNPKPNADGTYTVKLSPKQWQIFQDNQKKAPVPVPAEPENNGQVPADKPADKPADDPSDEISVTKDPST